jgi:hypothetical protein
MNHTHQTVLPLGWHGRRLLVPLALVALGLTPLLMVPSAMALPTDGQMQERLGQTIVMVTLHDQELLQTHLDQITDLMQERDQFQQGRAGRLQEGLGRAIVGTAQAIRAERLELQSRIRITRQELDLLSEDSPAGRQTQMGWVVRTAALRAAQDGTSFQAELGQEITRLEKVRQRTINRLQDELIALNRQVAEFPATIPQQYQKTMVSARRVVEMADASFLASLNQQIQERSHQVVLRQSPRLYAGLADLTRAAMAKPGGVGGFVEYGLAAMIGASFVMVWLGLANKKGGPAAPLPHRRISDVMQR